MSGRCRISEFGETVRFKCGLKKRNAVCVISAVSIKNDSQQCLNGEKVKYDTNIIVIKF